MTWCIWRMKVQDGDEWLTTGYVFAGSEEGAQMRYGIAHESNPTNFPLPTVAEPVKTKYTLVSGSESNSVYAVAVATMDGSSVEVEAVIRLEGNCVVKAGYPLPAFMFSLHDAPGPLLLKCAEDRRRRADDLYEQYKEKRRQHERLAKLLVQVVDPDSRMDSDAELLRKYEAIYSRK